MYDSLIRQSTRFITPLNHCLLFAVCVGFAVLNGLDAVICISRMLDWSSNRLACSGVQHVIFTASLTVSILCTMPTSDVIASLKRIGYWIAISARLPSTAAKYTVLLLFVTVFDGFGDFLRT